MGEDFKATVFGKRTDLMLFWLCSTLLALFQLFPSFAVLSGVFGFLFSTPF
jgi:hypothetical protein